MLTTFRFLATVFAVWALAGCAMIRAQQAEQARWQAMADTAVRYFQAASVYVTPISGICGRYFCTARTIELGTIQPDGDVRWLLAHEIAHHLNGDCTEGIPADEIRADLTAIKVLQVWGLTESQAANEVAAMLRRTAKNGTMTGLRGHDACAELAAVLRAYPV